MHHLPAGLRRSARLSSCLRRALRLRGRIAPVVLVCGVVTTIALGIPALRPITNSFTDAGVALGASAAAPSGAERGGRASRAERSGVVRWGVDGAPGTTAPSGTGAAPESSADTSAAASTGTSPSAPVATQESSTAPSPSSAAPSSGAPPAPAAVPAPASSAPAPAPAPAADTGAEGQVLTLVNQQRAAAGCGALVADEGLTGLARAFSADMRDRSFFSHTDPDGLSPFDRGDRAGVTVLAENIAYGQPDAAAVMNDWMTSDAHRANILNCSYTRLGVGIADGPGGPWWTQDFA